MPSYVYSKLKVGDSNTFEKTITDAISQLGKVK